MRYASVLSLVEGWDRYCQKAANLAWLRMAAIKVLIQNVARWKSFLTEQFLDLQTVLSAFQNLGGQTRDN